MKCVSWFMLVCALLCGTAAWADSKWDFPVAEEDYFNWYDSRSFYYNPTSTQAHIGEDVDLPEGTPVHAIADGKLVTYRTDGAYSDDKPGCGFGELYAVIEHDLGKEYEFVNALGQRYRARYVRSIYGHIRKSQWRGGSKLSWRVGDFISANSIIGYVNDHSSPDCSANDHNGDGAEHLHHGSLLNPNITSGLGYDTSDHRQAPYFAAPSQVIALMQTGQFATYCDEEIESAFQQAYLNNKMYETYLVPFSDHGGGKYVHDWWGVDLQNFKSYVGDCAQEGQCESALIYNPTHDKAYLVKQGFWCVYKGFNECYPGSDRDIIGPVNLGAPTSEEMDCQGGEGGKCQYFERGYLRYASPIKVTYGDYSSGPPGSPYYPQGPDVICKIFSQLSVAQRLTYYDGQMWNTSADVCDGFGWESDYCTGTVYSGTGCGLWSDPYDQGECWLGMNQDMVTSPPNIYHGQFYTSQDWPLDIDETKQYRLSFRARNHDPDVLPRNMKIILTAGDNYCSDWPLYTLEDQYTLVSDEQEITIENNYPDWQDYEVVLTPELSSSEATLRFFFGDKKGQIDVDDIVWTAEDQPVEDAPEVSNLLVNGDAENPNAGEWGLYNAYNVANFSRADWQVYDGDYSWYLTNALSAPECWYSQFYQDVYLTGGETYVLSYLQNTDNHMGIRVKVQKPNGSTYLNYSDSVLRGSWQKIQKVLTADQDTSARLTFQFGNTDQVRMFLDNLALWPMSPLMSDDASSTTYWTKVGSFELEHDTETETNSLPFGSRFLYNSQEVSPNYAKRLEKTVALTEGQPLTVALLAKAQNGGQFTFTLALRPSSDNTTNCGLEKTINLDRNWRNFVYDFVSTCSDPNARLTIEFGNRWGRMWFDDVSLAEIP